MDEGIRFEATLEGIQSVKLLQEGGLITAANASQMCDGASGVLIDISALEIVDSFVGRMLAAISGIGQILDATTVVVGMQPAVAITLVELGMSLDGVKTALNVSRGMALLQACADGDDFVA